MDTKLLKQKILDLAIHGKLVPQNPNDEPASKLLEKIREDRTVAGACGSVSNKKKIKADKNDSYIFVGDDNRHYEKFADGTVKDIEDEIPFEVPEGWAWCRLGSVYEVNPRVIGDDENLASFIPMERIEANQSNLFTYETDSWKIIKKNHTLFQDGDICFAKISPCFENGKAFIASNLINGIGAGTTELIVLRNELIEKKYTFYFLGCDSFVKDCCYTFNGVVGQQRISSTFVKNHLFPLPPIAEQKRIVKEIEHSFTLITSLEKNKLDLQTAIKQAKSKILDLAIHGKLVPQDSSDEPASVLLEKLRADKEAKIKAGELKRDKNDSYIYKNTTDNCYYQKFINGNETDITDEIPFEIPDNWSWCNLGEIYSHTTGKALKKDNNKGTLRKYITTSNLYWNSFDFTDVRTMYFTDDELEKCTIKKGDLVLCNGGDVGRAAIWKLEEDICYQNHVSRLRPKLSGINNSFYLYVIQINKEKGNLSGKGVGITSLSATDILNLKIPLPPLAEQKRIVGKIESLYSFLDAIVENLV